jgi:hypothetical protein
MDDDGATVDGRAGKPGSQVLTGTFVGTFTGRYIPSPEASPAPSPPSVSPAPPPVVTQPPTGATPAESPNNTMIPPATQIVDSYGGRWKVTSGVVYRNEEATPSANVKMLLYYNGAVYQTNEAGGWWKWHINQWMGTDDGGDPRKAVPTPAPTPVPTPAPGAVPSITTARHPADMLEIGKFWVLDNRWGKRGINEGAASYEFMQEVERSRTVTPEGGVAVRIKWKWPEFNQQGVAINDNPNYGEVKGYPAIIYGGMPGCANTEGPYPAWMYAVRAPDGVTVPSAPPGAPQDVVREWQPQGGSVITKVPCGFPPESLLPMKIDSMPDTPLVANFKWVKNAACTGRGHLSWDIWLQETNDQAQGFPNASITHEIMIPVGNWGIYGRHPNGRPPFWYSHDTTIDGVLYHVYFAGEGYTFSDGTLAGKFANEEKGGMRTGWKFIIFQHDGDNHPRDASGNVRMDLSKFIAHCKTRKDKNGVNYVRGTEYCMSAQLGVEQVWGNGDLTIYDFNVTGK